jgi:3-methylcrotonyl-CoA carboxylase alpha subunit
LPTNIGFLKTLANHHAFAAGDVDTHFIERFKPDLLPVPLVKQDDAVPQETRVGAALAAAAISTTSSRSKEMGSKGFIWNSELGFRLNHEYSRILHFDWKPEAGDIPLVPLALRVTHGKLGDYTVEVLAFSVVLTMLAIVLSH